MANGPARAQHGVARALTQTQDLQGFVTPRVRGGPVGRDGPWCGRGALKALDGHLHGASWFLSIVIPAAPRAF